MMEPPEYRALAASREVLNIAVQPGFAAFPNGLLADLLTMGSTFDYHRWSSAAEPSHQVRKEIPMFPTRLTIVTYNLWNTKRWDIRKPALEQFLHIYYPDILCIQELRQETRDYLDNTLQQHRRIHDDLPGWTQESNIYWKANFFTEVAHGAEDVGMLEAHRRLFWTRLALKDTDKTILVSTAHFTYQRHPRECETGVNPRMEQTRRTIQALDRLARDGEPVFFMGDLNDNIHPALLLHEAGYVSNKRPRNPPYRAATGALIYNLS